MNYYFLLEDEKSLLKVLPDWFKYMEFPLTRVADITELKNDNYVMQSGMGITQLITKVLYDTIDTINESSNKVDDLIIVLDCEHLSPNERIATVLSAIKEKYDMNKLKFRVRIFVSNKCFETWLLGHKEIYPDLKPKASSSFYKYYMHYNIRDKDPEYMYVPHDSTDTIGQYHFHYLSEMFRYVGKMTKTRITYTKSRPEYVKSKYYFDGIYKRIKETSHLKSCCNFMNFLSLVHSNIVFFDNSDDKMKTINLAEQLKYEYEAEVYVLSINLINEDVYGLKFYNYNSNDIYNSIDNINRIFADKYKIVVGNNVDVEDIKRNLISNIDIIKLSSITNIGCN